jgi:Tol biopolymer transport system component
VWAASGRDLLYTSQGGQVVMRRRADGSGNPELVLREPRGVVDLALTPDGRTIVLRIGADGTNRGDLYQFRIGIDSVPRPLLDSPAHEADPSISPDGRWLAYVASENGPPQVYVRPFPDVDAQRVQVSVNGGRKPHWKGAGNELFFLSDSGDRADMMVARVRTAPTFTVEAVQRLFTVSRFQSDGIHAIYDVSADGQQFLMLDLSSSGSQASASGIVAVQNFASELRRRLPQ